MMMIRKANNYKIVKHIKKSAYKNLVDDM